MTVLADPAVDSARGRQMTALLAAAHLAEHDLPPVGYWDVTCEGRLKIHLRPDTGAEVLAAVYAWATFLGADMRTRDGLPDTARVFAAATYRGAPVEVWATLHLPEPPDMQGES